MKDVSSNDFKIAKIDGPDGEFGIAFGGTTKEGFYYLYQDEKRRFLFFVDINPKPVWTVTVESTSGLHVTHDEEAALKKNIEFFFKTRDFSYPDRKAPEGGAAELVTFQWGIAR
jgi:hypothetical protein